MFSLRNAMISAGPPSLALPASFSVTCAKQPKWGTILLTVLMLIDSVGATSVLPC